MSSVQSFLKQRVVGTRTAAFNPLAEPGTYYQFQPAVGNYVGNYTPGYMYDVTAVVVGELSGATLPVMRDMGKTLKAVIGQDSQTQPVDLVTNAGFFREYQILVPSVVPSATSSTPFGVGGVAPTYHTVYVPIVVGGTLPGVAVGATGQAPSAVGASIITDGML